MNTVNDTKTLHTASLIYQLDRVKGDVTHHYFISDDGSRFIEVSSPVKISGISGALLHLDSSRHVLGYRKELLQRLGAKFNTLNGGLNGNTI